MASYFDGNNSAVSSSGNLDEQALNSSYFRRSDVAIPLPFRSSVTNIPIVLNSRSGTENSSDLRFPLVLPLDRRQDRCNVSESSEAFHFEGAGTMADQSTEIDISCSDIDLNVDPSNYLHRRTWLERIASHLCSPKEPRPLEPLQV